MVKKGNLYPVVLRAFSMEIAIDVFQAILLKSKTSFHPIKVFIFSLDSSLLDRFYLKGEPSFVNWFSGRN